MANLIPIHWFFKSSFNFTPDYDHLVCKHSLDICISLYEFFRWFTVSYCHFFMESLFFDVVDPVRHQAEKTNHHTAVFILSASLDVLQDRRHPKRHSMLKKTCITLNLFFIQQWNNMLKENVYNYICIVMHNSFFFIQK